MSYLRDDEIFPLRITPDIIDSTLTLYRDGRVVFDSGVTFSTYEFYLLTVNEISKEDCNTIYDIKDIFKGSIVRRVILKGEHK